MKSPWATVAHHSGQNKSAAATTAATPGSSTYYLHRRAQTPSVPPGAEAFTAELVDKPATASAAEAHKTVPLPADVPARATDAEAVTTALLVCDEPGCKNQPCIAEPGQTTGKPKLHLLISHPRLPGMWQQNSCVTTAITRPCCHTPTVTTRVVIILNCKRSPTVPPGYVVYHTPYGILGITRVIFY